MVYLHGLGTLFLTASMPISGEETTMHPTIEAEIMKTRTAGAHRRADQARLAQAARRGRRALRQHGTPRMLPGLRPRPVLHWAVSRWTRITGSRKLRPGTGQIPAATAAGDRLS
jgi:hypothetical protein